MKTKEEIEKLAIEKYPRLINDPYNPMEDDNSYERQIYIDGYTQCKEDMADKKYTEDDLRQAMVTALVSNSVNGLKDIDNYINSLNKQD